MAVELGAEAVEHLVDGDELRSLDVPMRLLGDQREVDRIGQPRVEQVDRYRLRIRLEVVFGGNASHGKLLKFVRQRSKVLGNVPCRYRPSMSTAL
jgi:hypothetical protein